jgi:hypothetical protein
MPLSIGGRSGPKSGTDQITSTGPSGVATEKLVQLKP